MNQLLCRTSLVIQSALRACARRSNVRRCSPHASAAVLVRAIRVCADADIVARGKYLVTVAGCNDCHTPWKTVRPARNRT